MIIEPKDIKFDNMSGSEFEEMCFDLLLQRGYEGLTWRKSGADSGRDIEGRLRVNNSVVGSYEEAWFVECKCYSSGVPPEVLNSKIAWADAEQPKHLLFIVSSHLTDGCREWLEKTRKRTTYKIHVIEGKQLTELLIQHQDLVERHCLDRFGKLLLDAKRRWLIHDLLPDHEVLALLSANLDTTRLSVDDVVFLWSSYIANPSEGVREESEPLSFEYLAQFLREHPNTEKPVLEAYKSLKLIGIQAGSDPHAMIFSHVIGARLLNRTRSDSSSLIYAFVYDSDGEGFEMSIEATSDYPTWVRHMPINARREADKQFEAIRKTRDKT